MRAGDHGRRHSPVVPVPFNDVERRSDISAGRNFLPLGASRVFVPRDGVFVTLVIPDGLLGRFAVFEFDHYSLSSGFCESQGADLYGDFWGRPRVFFFARLAGGTSFG